MTFSDFYQAIYDRSPFPWQVCLADRVIDANSGWPEVLDLPTAAGKTTVLDIAVFHLVHQLRTGVPRTAPLRIFSIVDRRIVVDGTFRHARRIADKLADAQDGPLRAAKDLIKSHFDVDRPLHVSMMRGGMYRDIGWISSPVQPTICVSTVDQVGSRLLFRGYGVTPSMRPVHAGLVANDSLLFIDEAHLSEPFLQTLAAVRSLTRVSAADEAIGRPLRFVRMSATSGDTEVKPFGLDENPHDLDTEHPVLKQRLAASKIATFKKVTVEKNDRDLADKHFARVASEQALSLAGFGPSSKTPRHKDSDDAEEPIPNPVRVVGIVVNRVRAARLIREELLQVVGRPDDDARKADVLLLTGRIRPFDRDELLFRCDANGRRGWLSWIAADRKEQPHRPLFVVATQTIEVGADISFDALVTEAAPLDCLRQRFGRLDRLGTRGRSSAVIVGRNTAVATNAVDPIYGTAIGETWTWLNRSDVARGSGATKSVDFGLAAIGKKLGNLSAADVSRMCAPRKNSPFLQTPYVELWSQTNPAPGADPDIARFLHGVETRPPDVQVIWRADLLNQGEAELLNEHEADYINATALVPPTQMEVCPVPVRDVREWLVGRPAEPAGAEAISDELADVEGGQTTEDEPEGSKTPSRPRLVLVWRGSDKSRLTAPRRIRAGDTIIVPASYGGCDPFGWQPGTTDSVTDVAESCIRWSRGRAVLRCHSAVARQWGVIATPLDASTSPTLVDVNAYLNCLTAVETLPLAVKRTIESLQGDDRRKVFSYELAEADSSPGFVLVGNERLSVTTILSEMQHPAEDPGELNETPEEDDASSFVGGGRPVSLDEHTEGVVSHLRRFAKLARLPDWLIDDLALAARWHDAGKIDPRFQAWLHAGDEIAALIAMHEGYLLGKSGMTANDRAAWKRARRLAGMPKVFRHEALSVMLLRQPQQAALLAQMHDQDLALFLIGSHHGAGRPTHTIDFDDDAPEIDVEWQGHRWQIDAVARGRDALHRIENDWPGLFARVSKRYDIWGLAWLEALFRLADHQQSSLDRRAADCDPQTELAGHA